MNYFSFTGVVRDKIQSATFDGEPYVAFVLIQDGGAVSIPCFAKGKLTKRIKRLGAVGSSVEVEGSFVSKNIYSQGVYYLRLYLVVSKFKRLAVPRILYSDNLVINKLIGLYEIDDLVKDFRRERKKKKAEGETNDQ